MKKKYIAPVLDVIPMYDEMPFLKASRIIVKDGDEIIDIEVPEETTDQDIVVDSKKNNLWDINLWSD